jgi:hypothetical protein
VPFSSQSLRIEVPFFSQRLRIKVPFSEVAPYPVEILARTLYYYVSRFSASRQFRGDLISR